jgi:hypothetical protein
MQNITGMKWPARKQINLSERSPHSEGDEWERWFAWYPTVVVTGRDSAQWVWLEFIDRKWRTSRYGSKENSGAIVCETIQNRTFNSGCTI